MEEDFIGKIKEEIIRQKEALDELCRSHSFLFSLFSELNGTFKEKKFNFDEVLQYQKQKESEHKQYLNCIDCLWKFFSRSGTFEISEVMNEIKNVFLATFDESTKKILFLSPPPSPSPSSLSSLPSSPSPSPPPPSPLPSSSPTSPTSSTPSLTSSSSLSLSPSPALSLSFCVSPSATRMRPSPSLAFSLSLSPSPNKKSSPSFSYSPSPTKANSSPSLSTLSPCPSPFLSSSSPSLTSPALLPKGKREEEEEQEEEEDIDLSSIVSISVKERRRERGREIERFGGGREREKREGEKSPRVKSCGILKGVKMTNALASSSPSPFHSLSASLSSSSSSTPSSPSTHSSFSVTSLPSSSFSTDYTGSPSGVPSSLANSVHSSPHSSMKSPMKKERIPRKLREKKKEDPKDKEKEREHPRRKFGRTRSSHFDKTEIGVEQKRSKETGDLPKKITSLARISRVSQKDMFEVSSRKEKEREKEKEKEKEKEREREKDRRDTREKAVIDSAEGNVLNYCTLPELIEELTTEKSVNVDLRSEFFLTYTSFCTPDDIVKHLALRYQKDSVSSICRVRVAAVLKHWIEEEYEFLFSREKTMKALQDLFHVITEKQPSTGKSLQAALDSKRVQFNIESERLEKVNFKQMDPSLPSFEMTWDKFNAQEVCLSLTFHEFELYSHLKPKEFVHWNKKTREMMCPNIPAIIALSNRTSSWVTSELVKRTRLADRITLLEKFVYLAQLLLESNNFSGLMSVIAGINNSSFRRMKKTWTESAPDVVKRFEKMEQLMTHNSCYAAYRAYIAGCSPPCIPYIGVYLTDLTFIDEGNKDSQLGLINFGKRKMEAKVLRAIQLYQNTRYSDVQTPPKNNFVPTFYNLDPLTEDQYYFYSKMVEPKDQEKATEELLSLFNDSQQKLEKAEKQILDLQEKMSQLASS